MFKIQNLLEEVYLTPAKFNFEHKEGKVYLLQNNRQPIHVGDLSYDIPIVAISSIKIKSWRLERNPNDSLSLTVNLVI